MAEHVLVAGASGASPTVTAPGAPLTTADGRPLARALAQDLSLWPENRSKAERAMQLAAGTWAAPVKAVAVELDAKGDPLAALRALADEVLAHWSGNLALLPYRHDPEYLHQIRVALRRLRALGIPSVLGCVGLTETAQRGDQAVLDGSLDQFIEASLKAGL